MSDRVEGGTKAGRVGEWSGTLVVRGPRHWQLTAIQTEIGWTSGPIEVSVGFTSTDFTELAAAVQAACAQQVAHLHCYGHPRGTSHTTQAIDYWTTIGLEWANDPRITGIDD